MKNRAFTLIELLVVIAIIAILAAILFPVFAQAKAAAKKTASLSNTKQLGTSISIYMGDVDDVYPMGLGVNWWAPRDGGWTYDTIPYVKSYAILLDPTDEKSRSSWDTWMQTQSDVLSISYAANGAMKWTPSLNSWAVYGVMGLHQPSWIQRNEATGSVVTKPSETIMLSARFRGNNVFGNGLYMPGVDWWDWPSTGGAPGLTPEGGAVDVTGRNRTGAAYTAGAIVFNTNDKYGGVSAVYANKAPFVYCDSHAKCLDPISTNPDGTNQPTKNQWDAYRADN